MPDALLQCRRPMAQPQLDQTWRGGGPARAAAAPAAPSRWAGLLMVHDAITLGYFAIVRLVLAWVPESSARSSVCRVVEAGFALAALGIAAARLVPRLPPLVLAVAY